MRQACFAFLSLWLMACTSSPKISSDFDASQDFSAYRTFAWISDDPMLVTGSQGPSPLVAERIKNAIAGSLASKGFRQIEERAQADFVVQYSVGARSRIDQRQVEVMDFYGPHWGWGHQYYGGLYAPGTRRTETITEDYLEGTLAIDVFDVQRRSPVWHGSASKRLSDAGVKGNSPERLREVTDQILASFPPQAIAAGGR